MPTRHTTTFAPALHPSPLVSFIRFHYLRPQPHHVGLPVGACLLHLPVTPPPLTTQPTTFPTSLLPTTSDGISPSSPSPTSSLSLIALPVRFLPLGPLPALTSSSVLLRGPDSVPTRRRSRTIPLSPVHIEILHLHPPPFRHSRASEATPYSASQPPSVTMVDSQDTASGRYLRSDLRAHISKLEARILALENSLAAAPRDATRARGVAIAA
jgi:hypothetical protein